MLLSDFLDAVRLVMLRRLKMDEWDVANAMSEHAKQLEICFREGFAPLEAISEITGTDLPEIFGDPNFEGQTNEWVDLARRSGALAA